VYTRFAFGVLFALNVAVVARAAEDTLETVYKSVTLTPGQLKEKGPFNPGDKITITFGLKNKTKKDLTPPVSQKSVGGKVVESREMGVIQYWIERLGNDPSIPIIKKNNPNTSTRGRQYAASGWTVQSPKVLKAGETFDFAPRVEDTTGYPKGKYRFTAELKDLKDKVLQSNAVDFELK
jgi:hypothetical protein